MGANYPRYAAKVKAALARLAPAAEAAEAVAD